MGKNLYEKNSVFINIAWKLFERGSSLTVTFLVQILLARVLTPSAFGLAAMVNVFVTISTIFVTGGLSSALIQKKNADSLDFSSIFWLNLLVSIILYLILFMVAPSISLFYGYTELTLMLRVLGIKILISAVNSIQAAYISRNMMFRFYFLSTLTGKVASGIIGVIIAIMGGGAWALVAQTLSMVFFETVVLWNRVKWRPEFKLSFERAKSLYNFAWKIMLMTFVESLRDQLRSLMIGKEYTSTELAYYDKGFLFPTNIVTNISSSLSAVMFPVLSNSQDNNSKLLTFCRSWTSMFAYTVLPILIGFIMTAEQVISVVLSEKWLASVPYLQLASIAYIAWIIEVPIRETLKSLGHATVILNLQIIKTLVSLITWLLILQQGVLAIAFSGALLGLFNSILSFLAASKLFGYKLKYLINDLLPTFMLNIVMGFAVFLVTKTGLDGWKILILQIFTGGIVYFLLSVITKNKNFLYFKSIIIQLYKKN